MSIVPVQSGMDASTPTLMSLTVDELALLEIPDPWERARQAADLAKTLKTLSSVAHRLRRQAVNELVKHHKQSQAEVARHIGVSPARVGQMIGRHTVNDRIGAVA